MDITIIQKKVVKKKDDDGVEFDDIEKVVHEFETHPNELIKSTVARFIKSAKIPEPPQGIRPTLGFNVMGATVPIDHTKTIGVALKETALKEAAERKEFVLTRM